MPKLRSVKAAAMAAAAVVAGGLTAGCAAPEPGSPQAIALEQKKQEEAKVEAVKGTIGQLPDWFLNLPKDANSVFSAGTSTSPDLQLAIDKAVLNAKRQLADRINGLLSSKMKEFATEIGSGADAEVVSEVERVTTNLITEVNVAGYQQEDAKVYPQANQYRAYVLLRYPVGSANRILVDQVKQNRVLEARMRASKAFQELERDIKEARERKN